MTAALIASVAFVGAALLPSSDTASGVANTITPWAVGSIDKDSRVDPRVSRKRSVDATELLRGERRLYVRRKFDSQWRRDQVILADANAYSP